MKALRDHPEQWPPDTGECIFLGRVLDRLSDDDAWTALRSRELEPLIYCVGRTDFEPIPLSPLVLLDMDKDAVFANCQIEMVDRDTRRDPRVRRRIPVAHWLFVTRASWKNFAKKNPATAGAEDRAIRDLAARLKIDPGMRREDAWTPYKSSGVSRRGFLNRVWPEARKLANLSAAAKAGAKSKR